MVKNIKYGLGLVGALGVGTVGGYLGSVLERKAVIGHAQHEINRLFESTDRLTTELGSRYDSVIKYLNNKYPSQPNLEAGDLAKRLKYGEFPQLPRKLRAEFLESYDDVTKIRMITETYFGMINGAKGIVDDENKAMVVAYDRWKESRKGGNSR